MSDGIGVGVPWQYAKEEYYYYERFGDIFHWSLLIGNW